MVDAVFSAATLAPRVKPLLESADFDALGAVLAPDVHWGAPDDPDQSCQNRQQVLDWWRRARSAGIRAEVTETTVFGNDILIGLRVTGHPHQDDGDRWQVLTVGNEGVVEIVGFDNRDEALARTVTHPPA